MTLKITQGGRIDHFLLMLCSLYFSQFRRYYETSAVHVIACDLEKSFSFH